MTRILAIDTSTAWCSVALSVGEKEPVLRHELVSAGASQLVLPWVQSLLTQAHLPLQELDAIAVGIGPGAFTGVRLGVAVVQGLAISYDLPILPVSSVDAIAAQLVQMPSFQQAHVKQFVVAIDARMDEVYWAKYEANPIQSALPVRLGEINVSNPEGVNLQGIQLIAGSAIPIHGKRLLASVSSPITMVEEIELSALGLLLCAKEMYAMGMQCKVNELEPLYVRNKVALTTVERQEAFK